MPRSRFALTLLLALAALAVAACAPAIDAPLTPTPDIAELEARTEERLAARLTAQAPLPTETPTPTPTVATPTPLFKPPSPTATPRPTATPVAPAVVFVQKGQDQTTHVVAPGLNGGDNGVLTHFPEPLSIDALVWSKEAEWLAFAGSHAFIRSRNNERNLFLMRPDGSEMRMVTGEFLDPADAPGPFVVLEGAIEGARGVCRVMAQGAASPVGTDEEQEFAFVLTGVPQEALWARAICTDGADTLQGDIALDLEEEPNPIAIAVAAQGQGWRDVSLAPGSTRMVGTHYAWDLDEEGSRRYQVRGAIFDIESGEILWLETPEGMTFHGADWSFDGERIIGGLAGEDAAHLWEWQPTGESVGSMLSIDNPEDEILAIVRPRWSPRETGIVFELHRWHWWGDPRFRTDLMLLEPGQEDARELFISAWGHHATHAAWGASGKTVFYQSYTLEEDTSPGLPPYADIWYISIQEPEPGPWTDDGASYLPAVRPYAELP